MKLRLAAAATFAMLLGSCASTTDDAPDGWITIPTQTSQVPAVTQIPKQTVPGDRAAQAAVADENAPGPALPLVDIPLRSATPDTPSGYVVAYYGDSLAASAQQWVGTYLEQAGLIFLPGTFPGSSLCDWYPRFDEDQANYDLWAVVLFFTNNTFSDCMKGPNGEELSPEEALAKFESDLIGAIDRFTIEGATVYLPTIPQSRGEVTLGIDVSAELNELFSSLASRHSAVVVVDAAPAVLDENGFYTETLPCLAIEPCTGGVDESGVPVNLVREPDGVHFCTGGYGPGVEVAPHTCPTWSSGAFRYGGALAAPIVQAAQLQWVADHPPANVPNQVDPAG